jgi:hypothetical protein
MHESSILTLKKLTTGKNGLSRPAFEALCREIKSEPIEAIAEVLFAKPAKKSPPKQAKPDWLLAMEKAKKLRNTWTAADFVEALYIVAMEQGWLSSEAAKSRPANLSFPKAAERLAAIAGGEKLKRAFIDFIHRHVARDLRS